MSRRARLLRKHRRLMGYIDREEALNGRTLRLWRSIAARGLQRILHNVRSQRWR